MVFVSAHGGLRGYRVQERLSAGPSPADFYAALLSSQPMGFYPSNTLVWEAKRRGISFLPPDVNASEAPFTVEEGAIRVGLVQIHGLGEESRRAVLEAREAEPFRSIADLAQRSGVNQRRLAQSHPVRRLRFAERASAAGLVGVRGADGGRAEFAAERGGGAGGAGRFFRTGEVGARVFAPGDRARRGIRWGCSARACGGRG